MLVGRWLIAALLPLAVVVPGVADAAEAAADEPLRVVRTTVDALLEHGRDRWGPRETALLASLLDRRTLAPPEKLPRAAAGVREGDRSTRFGSNANMHQNLYRVMFLLTELDDQPRYRQAAELALLDFVRLTQSPETHLLGWGEHLCYDLAADEVSAAEVRGGEAPLIHEMKKRLAFWDLLYRHEPERMLRFARGLWEHQIADQRTGDFSRHARWNKHAPGRGYDFTKEGGYMIDVWGRAYAASGDEVFRQAVDVLATRYRNKLNERWLLDYDSVRPNYCNNGHNVTLAMECHETAERFARPADSTARLLRELAGELDRGFLAVGHVPADPQRGFIATCLTDSGEPCDREGPGPGGYSVGWGMGYGKQMTAMVALHCYHRFRQLPEGEACEAFRALFLDAARRYQRESIPTRDAGIDVWAVEPGVAIQLLIAAHRETGEAEFLSAAQRLASESIERFWDASSPLPRSSLLTSHYEALTGGETLLLALLAVHAATHELSLDVPITELDR